ncbi:NAD(P)H-dependent oxidoreductase [Galbibacter sp.]|uniref:NAD(P)H-dependent oxidoreductase n=1 Tax=Galbibacter sp. TaxID=2918471 RepID=UPI003A924DB2
MKTLVVVIHPDMHASVFNKRWVEELKKFPDEFHVHELHKVYPDEKIDVIAEQNLIEKFDKIVFQFPFYWFNCPPFFKKWLDEVLRYGWAFGKKSGYKLKGRKIALAITIGIDQYEYHENEKYKYTMQELLRPFELTFEYVKADYKPFFPHYGIELNSSNQDIEESVKSYMRYLRDF